MYLLPDLTHRNLVPERMDDPSLPEEEHALALRGLRRINKFSGTLGQFERIVVDLATRRPKQHWTILDIGCANGENAVGLHQRLSRKLSLTVLGWDISPYAIEQAEQLRKNLGLSSEQCRFETRDALEDVPSALGGEQMGEFPVADIVINSLFLHHFEENQAIRLLRRMSELAGVAVVTDDLLRTRLGWVLAKVGCHLLSRSSVVHFDGPQSVKAAFRLEEFRRLAEQAGLHPSRVVKHWPERCALIWERETNANASGGSRSLGTRDGGGQ